MGHDRRPLIGQWVELLGALARSVESINNNSNSLDPTPSNTDVRNSAERLSGDQRKTLRKPLDRRLP